MLRSFLRAVASSAAVVKPQTTVSDVLIPVSAAVSQQLSSSRTFSTKVTKQSLPKGKKSASKADEAAIGSLDAETINYLTDGARLRALAEDENNKSLDVGPNGQPLFTAAGSLSQLSRKDACSYMKFRCISNRICNECMCICGCCTD